MANTGKDSNKSQFFITYARQPQLDDHYTAIGRVIHGFEVLDAMESGTAYSLLAQFPHAVILPVRSTGQRQKVQTRRSDHLEES